ncbi:MAG: HAMP domain-containing histidine kinase [Devosiaceae bacterium]|nr:HAMP domain-containing histidine kinase [Devosiaceae bacterium]
MKPISLRPNSLRLRLFAASATSIIIALIIAGFVISSLFASHIESSLKSDLSNQFDRLIAQIDPEIDVPTLKAPLADPRFQIPYGDIYWQITDAKTNARSRSRSMWDQEFNLEDKTLFDRKLNIANIIDPEGTLAIAFIQRLQFEKKDGSFIELDIILAEDLNNFYKATKQFRFDLLRALAILAVALSIAAWVQIALGLAPLSKIKQDISAIRTGSKSRMNDNHPPEVMPLIDEVNELLDTQDKSISFARTRASNLAHGLKTALTVLNSEIENIRKSGNQESAKIIAQNTNDMSAIIDHQLRLSRLKTRSKADHFATPLLKHLNRVVNTLKKTPKGTKIEWHIDISGKIEVDLDEPDLLELLGIIIENATQWANSNIHIQANVEQKHINLIIEDDGKGLSEKQLNLLGKRGLRLDSKGSGTGIGISIANEIVIMNSGKLNFEKSNKGGLKVLIQIPI